MSPFSTFNQPSFVFQYFNILSLKDMKLPYVLAQAIVITCIQLLIPLVRDSLPRLRLQRTWTSYLLSSFSSLPLRLTLRACISLIFQLEIVPITSADE